MNPPQEQLSIAEQAAQWVRRLNTEDARQSAEFVAWIKASPVHVRELLLASWLDDELGTIDPERRIDVRDLIARAQSNVSPIGGAHVSHRAAVAEAPAPPAPQSSWIGRAAAAIALVTVLGIAVWFARSTLDNSYTTSLGEQRVFELADGSVVFLNTESRIQVRYSDAARDIYLRDGQALFQVRHDAKRPFRVHAGTAVIQAIGTQFDVRLRDDRILVAVVEGTVQVSSGAATDVPAGQAAATQPARVTAGEGATIETGGLIEVAGKVDAEAITAWRQQRLVFRDTPLGEITEEFNRYNTSPKLHVEGDGVAALRYNGSFNAHSPESLINYLIQDQGLDFERKGDDVIIREHAGTAQSPEPASP